MRAVLFGGPVDRRVLDEVPETTEYVNIPASRLDAAKYARYARTGNAVDRDGKYLRFEFVAVFGADHRPLTAM